MTMTPTARELAARNAIMLADPEACPSAPLQDNTAAIQDRFESALLALVDRMQDEVCARYGNGGLPIPRIEIVRARKPKRFICIMAIHPTRNSMGVVGFVEVGTGLMWKAASRKAPVLNYPRGCIFNLDAIPAGELRFATFDSITTKIDLG